MGNSGFKVQILPPCSRRKSPGLRRYGLSGGSWIGWPKSTTWWLNAASHLGVTTGQETTYDRVILEKSDR
jgi:hypothetical protein